MKHYTDWSAYEPFSRDLSRCPGDAFSYQVEGDVADGGPKPGALMPASESKLAAMHYSSLGGYRALSVRGRASISISREPIACGSVISRHSVILVEPGASLELRADLGAVPGALDLSFIELIVGEGSSVDAFLRLGPSGGAPSASGLRVALGSGSKLNYLLLGSGGRMHHQDDRIILGPSASLRAGAFLLSPADTRIDRFLAIDHAGAGSSSSVSAIGVALDGGYVVVRGIASLEEGAARSRTEFTAGVALMGEGARGYAVPMLEVHTGEVLEAKHHSFEAKPSEDQLFYLRSRGLSESEAKGLVMFGLASSQLGVLGGRLARDAASTLGDLMASIGIPFSPQWGTGNAENEAI
ncbi:MAG: SufB/SufD family protein [Conexivisphaera sp.]